MKAALRVLQYLERTVDIKLTLGNLAGKRMCEGTLTIPDGLFVFTDSSWGDERPPYGYCVYHKGALVSWAARTLKNTPMSSCESEYDAATAAAMAAEFVRGIVEDITGKSSNEPTTIYCDNSAACQLAEDALSGKRMKHAMRKLTYRRELREARKIILKFISGEGSEPGRHIHETTSRRPL